MGAIAKIGGFTVFVAATAIGGIVGGAPGLAVGGTVGSVAGALIAGSSKKTERTLDRNSPEMIGKIGNEMNRQKNLRNR